MTVSTRYGMSNLLETSSKTFSKVEEGVVNNLVRITGIETSDAATKVYIQPLSLTDFKTAKEAKEILANGQFATLCLLKIKGSKIFVLETCKSLSSEISNETLVISGKRVIKNNVFVVVDSNDGVQEEIQLELVNYWNDEYYQHAVTFFKKWYAAVAAKARAARQV